MTTPGVPPLSLQNVGQTQYSQVPQICFAPPQPQALQFINASPQQQIPGFYLQNALSPVISSPLSASPSFNSNSFVQPMNYCWSGAAGAQLQSQLLRAQLQAQSPGSPAWFSMLPNQPQFVTTPSMQAQHSPQQFVTAPSMQPQSPLQRANFRDQYRVNLPTLQPALNTAIQNQKLRKERIRSFSPARKRPRDRDEKEDPASVHQQLLDLSNAKRSRNYVPNRESEISVHRQLVDLANAKGSNRTSKKWKEDRSRSRSPRNHFRDRDNNRTMRYGENKERERREKAKLAKYESIPVNVVKIPNVITPEPVEDFASCEFHEQILQNLVAESFTKPTPIQRYAIPIIQAKHDVMAAAHTGSGKTLAFLAPILSNIITEGEVPRPFFPGKIAFASPLGVVIIPTRELATQLDEMVWKLTKNTWIRSFVIFGGDNFNDQSDQIAKAQIDFLTATPGRLLDMLNGNKISLEFVKYLVLDEADNILDLGLEPQTRSIVLERDLPAKENRTTIMFSATFPEKIDAMAKEFLRPYVFLRIGKIGQTTDSIRQEVKWIDDSRKQKMLLKDLTRLDGGKLIVFVGRRQLADMICKFLNANGHGAGSLHGQQDSRQRERMITRFKEDKFQILCATSIAARGLDFPDIAAVINYDFPLTMETYTHRISRTGRIGDAGIAISYFNNSSQSLSFQLASFLAKHNQVVPGWLRALAARLSDRAAKKKAAQSKTLEVDKYLSNQQIIEQNTFTNTNLQKPVHGFRPSKTKERNGVPNKARQFPMTQWPPPRDYQQYPQFL